MSQIWHSNLIGGTFLIALVLIAAFEMPTLSPSTLSSDAFVDSTLDTAVLVAFLMPLFVFGVVVCHLYAYVASLTSSCRCTTSPSTS